MDQKPSRLRASQVEPRRPFDGYVAGMSRAVRLERVMGRALAAVCFVFGLQTLPLTLRTEATMNQTWSWIFGLTLYAALLGTVVAGLTTRFLRTAASAVTVSFIILLATWPFAAADLSAVLPTEPWPWYLCNVATAAAAIAFSDIAATGYTLLVATCYFLVRLTPAGGSTGAGRALLDSGYAFLIGIAVVLIVGLLRVSAAGVDAAEGAAIRRYSAATREHATEVERMNVDALLHDSVLAALLAGSRTDTPSGRRYATALARTAMDVIAANTGTPTSEPVSLSEVSSRFTSICTELGIEARLSARGLEDSTVPASVAEVFFAASLQALMNSVQHAGPGTVHRSVDAVWAAQRLTVTLSDDGVGFDVTAPTSRLGIRTSIVQRMESVGGAAVITSAPGAGATVTLTWQQS